MILRKIASAILLTVALTACKETSKNDSNADSATDASVATSEEVLANTTYEQKVEKINVITNNYNDVSSNVFKVYQSYIDIFGDDPTKFTAIKPEGNYEIYDYVISTLNNLDAAMAIPVMPELNPYMETFKNSGLAFSKTMNEVNTYYKMKDYNIDNFEKGKTMHKPIIEGFQQFYETDSILRIHSDKALAEIDKEFMNMLKEDGFELQYLTKKAVNNATKLIEMLATTEFENLEADKLKALHDPLRVTFDELTALKANDYETYNAEYSISFFYESFEATVLASDELYQRVKEQRPFTSMEQRRLSASGAMANGVTGTPDNVREKYRSMIDRYNNMQ